MDSALVWIVVIMLAALCVSTGLHKLGSPSYYRALIGRYVPVGETVAALAQTGLGLAEIAIAVLLLLETLRPVGALLAAQLFLAYGVLMGVSLWRGLDVDCGCSGPLGKRKLSPWLLLRNLLLCTLAAAVRVAPEGRPLGLADWLMIGIAAGSAMLIYVGVEQLLTNRQTLQSLRHQ